MISKTTWDRVLTHAWLTNEFAKRIAKKKGQARKAATTFASLEESTEGLDLGLDIDKVCPGGYTARSLGALYTTESVERCLSAQTEGAGDMELLKNRAAEVYRTIFLSNNERQD